MKKYYLDYISAQNGLMIIMSKDDLMSVLGTSSSHTLHTEFMSKIRDKEIINIFLVNEELIKIGNGSDIKKEDIINITPDYLTIKYDSHITDVMFTAISKIEYY